MDPFYGTYKGEDRFELGNESDNIVKQFQATRILQRKALWVKNNTCLKESEFLFPRSKEISVKEQGLGIII